MSRILECWTRVSVIATVLLPLLVATNGLASPGVPHGDDTIVLRGTVVNIVDGTPIRTALVQLTGEKPRVVLTGADGGFQFEGLAAGEAVIVARKPGYFSAQEYYPESIGQQRVHLAPNLQPLKLKLYPEAVVYGKVTNENGRPLEGFTVQLTRAAGAKSPTSRRGEMPSTVTNESGEYRLAELREGTYLVSVSWKMDSDGPVSLFQASKLRSGYPTYFHPDVTDPALATPVRLTPGRQVQADLRLTSQPLYRIAGNVQGASGDGPILIVVVGQHDETPVAANAIMPGLTSFVLEGVPSGSYFVGAIQTSQGGRTEEKTGISGIVEVTQNVDALSITLSEKKRVQVRFRYQYAQSTGIPAEGLGMPVSLIRTDLLMQTDLFSAVLMPNPSNPEEATDIELDPGTYRARINGELNRCVASVKSGATDLLAEDLVVTAGGAVQPIEVVMRDDCGQVQGTVTKDGQPAMGRVLLIPEQSPLRGVSTPANSDGAFRFQGLIPGKYLAVALDGADDLDADDPGTLTKVKSRATSVELQDAGTTTIALELKSLEP